jgi:hypothetical protein
VLSDVFWLISWSDTVFSVHDAGFEAIRSGKGKLNELSKQLIVLPYDPAAKRLALDKHGHWNSILQQ